MHQQPEVDASSDKSRLAAWWIGGGCVAAVLIVGIGIVAWMSGGTAKPAVAVDDELDHAMEVVNPGYVGMSACAECHRQRVEEFQKTRHAQACVPGTQATFTTQKQVYATRDPNLRFEMSRQGGQCVVTTVKATPLGEQRESHDIALAYGAAGKSDEMYFVWQGNHLYGHTIAWLYPFQCWGHVTEEFSIRGVESRCLECHNTWIAHVPGSVNEYRREDMLLGVTCERCHGPGNEHVQQHRARPSSEALAIVRPGELPRERQIEVCTQCHSASFKRKERAFSYRPGEPLEAHFRTAKVQYPEDDLVANQIQYLRESRCFQSSEMTCITCHNPHQHDSAESYERSCLQCHQQSHCGEQPRLPDAVKNDCKGCHMPRRVWMGARFHTASDEYLPITLRAEHRIAVYPEARDAVLLAWLKKQTDDESQEKAAEITTRLAQHWLDEADRRSGQSRLIGVTQALREAVRVDPQPATTDRLKQALAQWKQFDTLNSEVNERKDQPLQEKLDLLARVLKLNPQFASAYGRMGTIHAMLGERAKALDYWKKVAEHDPEDAYGLTMLGQDAMAQNDLKSAADFFQQADEVDPYNSQTHYLWGTVLMQLGQLEDAESHLAKALEIDPKNVAACQSLSELLLMLGRGEEARRYQRRAERLQDLDSSQRPQAVP